MFKRLFQLVVANWPAKLVALVLATGLWAFVVNSGYRQDILPDQLPITVRDVTEGLAVAGTLPTVQVEVRAPTASFKALTPGDLHAFVNAAGLEAGLHTLEVKVAADDPNVRILNITPTLADVRLEKRQTKSFKVELETEGDLGQGFVGDTASFDPKNVAITGATSALAAIAKVVVHLPLNGETSTVEKTLTSQALDADRNVINGLIFNPEQIKVRLKVARAEDAKEVGVAVETTGAPAAGFFVGTITVDPATVTAQGSSTALAKLQTLKTESINLDGATEQIQTTIKLALPPNVRAEPATVKVTIEIKAGKTSQEITLPPEITNLSAGTGARVDPASVTVTLTGATDKVRAFVRNGVHLRIDASGHGAGDFTVTLTESMLGLPADVHANFSVGSVTVHVT